MQLIAYRQAISCGMTTGPSWARGAGVHPASNAPSAAGAATMTARIRMAAHHDHIGGGRAQRIGRDDRHQRVVPRQQPVARGAAAQAAPEPRAHVRPHPGRGGELLGHRLRRIVVHHGVERPELAGARHPERRGGGVRERAVPVRAEVHAVGRPAARIAACPGSVGDVEHPRAGLRPDPAELRDSAAVRSCSSRRNGSGGMKGVTSSTSHPDARSRAIPGPSRSASARPTRHAATCRCRRSGS